jgi:hypothetical protein
LQIPFNCLLLASQDKLELGQERSAQLELELQKEKQRGEKLKTAVLKEKQLGWQKLEIERGITQELKRKLLIVEGQRDSLNTQVMQVDTKTVSVNFQRYMSQQICSFLGSVEINSETNICESVVIVAIYMLYLTLHRRNKFPVMYSNESNSLNCKTSY